MAGSDRCRVGSDRCLIGSIGVCVGRFARFSNCCVIPWGGGCSRGVQWVGGQRRVRGREIERLRDIDCSASDSVSSTHSVVYWR